MAALLGWILIASASALGVFLLWSAFIGAGWQPTSRRKVRKMLEMCRVGPSDVVYDLGSGDGRILVEAAKTYHATAVGVEADPIRVLFSRFAVGTNRLKGRARVVWGNFFHVDLSEATVVTLFLSQGANRKLKAKLLSELRPGARVVSYVWTFDGWSPASRDADDEISLYVVPSHDLPSPDLAATVGLSPRKSDLLLTLGGSCRKTAGASGWGWLGSQVSLTRKYLGRSGFPHDTV